MKNRMKRKNKIMAILMAAAAAVLLALPFSISAAEEPKTADMLFLHDGHSHLDSFSTVENGQSVEMGGLSRVMTLAKEQFAENPDTLFLDAGDFSMGTLVQTIFETEAAELRMLGALNVAATTFGNHEFDYGSVGLANTLLCALESEEEVPAMVVSNLDLEGSAALEYSESRQRLLEALEAYGIKEYLMITKGETRIAVMGLFGIDALECAPTCELLFRDPVEAAKETVAKIQAEEDADMIVCISHSGTWAEEDKSEDEILAKSVPQIDLIISGHTHTRLEEPIVHGDTYIVSAQEYGKYLGSLSMEQKADGRWTMQEYALIPVTPDVAQDTETQEKIDMFLGLIDAHYLSRFGYTKDQVLAENDVVFSSQQATSTVHTEHNLGSIMADGYRYTIEHLPDYDGIPVDVAIVPAGTIRESYPLGEITVEHVFHTFSLGIGPDGVPGYPLLSVYLTGEELKLVAEIDASISNLMPSARLYSSGLHWTFNPNRMILNKTTEVCLVTAEGERRELEDGHLYRVVADLYSAQMLGAVTNMSYGLLSIVPKHADGTPIEDYNDAILMTEGMELKAWAAIANYIGSFEDTDGDGIPNVPAAYATEQGRKIVEDSKSLGDLLKNPNRFFFLIIGIALAALLILALLAVLVVFLVRKTIRKGKKQSGLSAQKRFFDK